MKPLGTLVPLPSPSQPWESLSMDLIVDLPNSQDHTAILIVLLHALLKDAHHGNDSPFVLQSLLQAPPTSVHLSLLASYSTFWMLTCASPQHIVPKQMDIQNGWIKFWSSICVVLLVSIRMTGSNFYPLQNSFIKTLIINLLTRVLSFPTMAFTSDSTQTCNWFSTSLQPLTWLNSSTTSRRNWNPSWILSRKTKHFADCHHEVEPPVTIGGKGMALLTTFGHFLCFPQTQLSVPCPLSGRSTN